jgi:two-component system cell cycle sensor histidine kinase/response regulator CckA
MLERLGYKVTATTSSVEALETFRADPEKFDLIITDQTMPTMTGEMLAKEIIGIKPDTPLVLCTGYSEMITKEKTKALGIRELVTKPILISNLAEAIRRAKFGPYEEREKEMKREELKIIDKASGGYTDTGKR